MMEFAIMQRSGVRANHQKSTGCEWEQAKAVSTDCGGHRSLCL